MENIINLCDFAVSSNLELPEQGNDVHQKIFPIVKQYIERSEKFNITFHNINNVTTAFLNNCVGKFFFEFDREKVEKLMSFSGFTNKAQITTLRHSISNAISLSKIQ